MVKIAVSSCCANCTTCSFWKFWQNSFNIWSFHTRNLTLKYLHVIHGFWKGIVFFFFFFLKWFFFFFFFFFFFLMGSIPCLNTLYQFKLENISCRLIYCRINYWNWPHICSNSSHNYTSPSDENLQWKLIH